MISSNNYWKILGATIATTATALWAKITNNGQNDADLTVEEIENKIRLFCEQARWKSHKCRKN